VRGKRNEVTNYFIWHSRHPMQVLGVFHVEAIRVNDYVLFPSPELGYSKKNPYLCNHKKIISLLITTFCK